MKPHYAVSTLVILSVAVSEILWPMHDLNGTNVMRNRL